MQKDRKKKLSRELSLLHAHASSHSFLNIRKYSFFFLLNKIKH
jgi:hypothetical protein